MMIEEIYCLNYNYAFHGGLDHLSLHVAITAHQ